MRWQNCPWPQAPDARLGTRLALTATGPRRGAAVEGWLTLRSIEEGLAGDGEGERSRAGQDPLHTERGADDIALGHGARGQCPVLRRGARRRRRAELGPER